MKWVTTLDLTMTQVEIDPMWLSSVVDLRKHEIALHDYTKSSLYYSQEKTWIYLILYLSLSIHLFIQSIPYFRKFTNY